MPVSSNSIIHYTKTIDALKSIVKDLAFNVKYCIEEIVVPDGVIPIAIPMVSFCDIPFTNITLHAKAYGYFGIGLSKKWAIENKLNPVLYLEENSYLTLSINSLLDKVNEGVQFTGEEYEIHKDILGMLCHIKNYAGDLMLRKKNKILDNYNFYNEREWRYIPYNSKDLDLIISEESYSQKKEYYNNNAKCNKLAFDLSDINYIIMNNERQVEIFVNYIRKKTDLNIEKINRKIITFDQIRNDF
jgi:hypothetical protein